MTDTEMTKLAACPFCGGSAHRNIESPSLHEVSCGECQCGTYLRPTGFDVIAAWNRRSPSPAVVPEVASVAARILRAAQVLGNRIDMGEPMTDDRRECVQALADLRDVAEEVGVSSPAVVTEEVREALAEARAGLVAYTGGPDGACGCTIAKVDATLSTLGAGQPASAWQNIASAPKDGTRVLLGGCKNGPSIRLGAWGNGRYLSKSKGFERDWADGSDYGFAPTCWQPLPDSPSSKGA